LFVLIRGIVLLKIRYQRWKKELSQHKLLILTSLGFLILAAVANSLAGIYADRVGFSSVTDLILDHLPSLDLAYLLVYGYIMVILVLFLYPLFFKVRTFHVVVVQASLLIIVRSIFMTFTHLKEPAEAVITDVPRLYSLFNYQNDLFFSGHTAIPFLGFLLFRKDKIRTFFLLSTIVMAATVLLMHVHYSIDVFSAFFITYGIYKIGQRLVAKFDSMAFRRTAKSSQTMASPTEDS
jgi:hypothetical protein